MILNGYDTFRQLFPKTTQQMFSRQRVHDTYTAFAQITSDRSANFSTSRTSGESLDLIDVAEDHYNYRFDLNQQGQPFQSFNDKFGGVKLNGDVYSALQQWNFSDPLLTSNATTGAGMDVTGYGSRQNFTQPFLAENIVMVCASSLSFILSLPISEICVWILDGSVQLLMRSKQLYDGVCASTCTLFSEMMRTEGKVQSILIGGRSNNRAAQAIGGTKGAQSLSFDSFYTYVSSLHSPPQPSPTNTTKKPQTQPILPRNRPSKPTSQQTTHHLHSF